MFMMIIMGNNQRQLLVQNVNQLSNIIAAAATPTRYTQLNKPPHLEEKSAVIFASMRF